MPLARDGRSRDRRRRWTLGVAYISLIASCDSPLAPDVEEVTRLDVSPAVLTMIVGGSANLIARVYGVGDALLPTARVFWSTQDPTVVTVDQAGVVSAIAAGTAQIAASSGGQSRTTAVTVSQRPIALVRITPPAGNVVAGGTLALSGEALDGTGALLPNRPLEWTSSAPAIATVNNTGVVTGIAVGEATISASGEGKIGTAVVTVLPSPATQLALTTPPPSTANSGQVFSSVSVVRLRDVSGNHVLQAGISVTATVSPSAGVTLAGGSSTTDGTGAALFSALTLTGPAGNYTLTFSSGSLTPVVSGTIALGAGGGSRLGLSVQPSPTVQSGVAFPVQPLVQLQDGAGNPVAQAGVVVSVAILSGGGTLGGSTTASTNASGVATFSGLSISGTIGVRTLLFGATGYTTVTSNNINMTPGPAAALVISVQPSASVQSGTAFATPPSIQLRDAGGNAVTQSGVVVSVSLNGAGASLTGGTTATTNAGGTATFTGLGLSGTVGTYSLSFSSGSLTGATSNSINLVAGAASQLTMATQPPASVISGTAFSTSPAVQLRDGAGNPLTTNGVSVSVAISAGGATLTGTTTQTTSNGIATFTGLGASGTPGSYTLSFSSAGLTGATSSSFNVVAPSPSQLTVTTQPAGAASGAAFTTQPRIQVRDAGGNPVSQAGISVTASIASGPGGATLLGSGSATTDASGLAIFSGLGLSGTVGNYTIAFASTGLTGVTSATIALGPGAPALLTIVTQPAGASSGAAFTTQPAVQVRDAQSNPVATAGIAVTAADNGGATLVGSGTASTNSSGVATFSGLGLSGLVGNYTVTFSSSGTPGVTSGSIALGPGVATALMMSTHPSATVASGSALATPPAVQLRDGAGNLVSQAGVNVTVAIGSGASLTGSTSAATDASGIATFTGLGISGLVGSYTLSFASGGLTGTTSSSISVTPGPAAQLAMVTQPPATSISGSAFSTAPAVRLRDAAGNSVSQSGVSISAAVTGGGASVFGSATAATNGSGIATFSGLGINGVGPFTITFSGTGLTSVVSSAIVVSEPATQLSMSSQPSASAQSGAAFAAQPAVQLRTAGGNPVNQSGVSVTAQVTSGAATLIGTASATTNGSGVATFTNLGLSGTVGSYTLTFVATGLADAVSNAINLTAGAAAKLRIDQQPSGTATSGQAFSRQPIIQLLDAQNNVVTTSGINVSAAVASGPVGASASGGASVATNSQGRAVFATLGITGPIGTYTISFSATGLTGVTSSSILIAAFSFDSTESPANPSRDAAGEARLSRGHETASLSGTLSVATHTLGLATFLHLTTDQTGNHALPGGGRIVVVSNTLPEAIAKTS